jgi:hypothetical protein
LVWIVDRTFRSLFKDLMQHFGMSLGEDYIDIPENASSRDFVMVSEKAQKLLEALFEGRENIAEHISQDKTGHFIFGSLRKENNEISAYN